jgi:cystathionine gamma-synthase
MNANTTQPTSDPNPGPADSLAARQTAVPAQPNLLTQAVHAGEARHRAHHSLTVPIMQTATYTFSNTAAVIDYMEEHMFWEEPERDEYGRYGNPTVRAAESKLAALEGGQDALLVSSGMAAITATLLIMLSQGDHMVITNDCYRRTRGFCNTFLPRFGVEVTPVPAGDYAAMEAAIRPNTRLIFSESPTNPFLHCLDFPRLAQIAKQHNLRTIVDSTLATPINLRPLEYGADLVVHSVTKYLAGHNDLLAGCVVGRHDLTTALRQSQGILGCIVDPHAGYLILRGLKTLGLRVRQQNASGLAVARFLEEHPKVRRVWYPGLESHPDHAVARMSMAGFGGLISFEIDGDGPAASRFIDGVHIPRIGPSLGGVESLVEQPAIISYYDTDPDERHSLGISDELVRLSLGIEDTDDLIADLSQALDLV